jgi:hypothetical protein
MKKIEKEECNGYVVLIYTVCPLISKKNMVVLRGVGLTPTYHSLSIKGRFLGLNPDKKEFSSWLFTVTSADLP